MHKNYGGMGFKDLSVFNLAVLEKQKGWKFQMEPQSLVSHIFKAMCFPNKSYLRVNLGHNPSYVKRNVLCARFIVHIGGNIIGALCL